MAMSEAMLGDPFPYARDRLQLAKVVSEGLASLSAVVTHNSELNKKEAKNGKAAAAREKKARAGTVKKSKATAKSLPKPMPKPKSVTKKKSKLVVSDSSSGPDCSSSDSSDHGTLDSGDEPLYSGDEPMLKSSVQEFDGSLGELKTGAVVCWMVQQSKCRTYIAFGILTGAKSKSSIAGDYLSPVEKGKLGVYTKLKLADGSGMNSFRVVADDDDGDDIVRVSQLFCIVKWPMASNGLVTRRPLTAKTFKKIKQLAKQWEDN
jgi:hypothetical protein